MSILIFMLKMITDVIKNIKAINWKKSIITSFTIALAVSLLLEIARIISVKSTPMSIIYDYGLTTIILTGVFLLDVLCFAYIKTLFSSAINLFMEFASNK